MNKRELNLMNGELYSRGDCLVPSTQIYSNICFCAELHFTEAVRSERE